MSFARVQQASFVEICRVIRCASTYDAVYTYRSPPWPGGVARFTSKARNPLTATEGWVKRVTIENSHHFK